MTAHQRPVPGAPKNAANNFRLDGPSIALDPRIHAFRPDVADLALAGQVFATHYARPETRRCVRPSAMIWPAAAEEGTAISQILYGEEFSVVDVGDCWAWGYSRHDHYVGYVAADCLAPLPAPAPTHIVAIPLALVFAEPDIKSPLRERLPVAARISARETSPQGFIRSELGWLHPRHVRPVDEKTEDFVEIAERLLGLPYLWGGRGGGGIDCSGLVQIALSFAGVYAPRDSDQQRDGLGRQIPADTLRRGDLVCFPGHIGIMADSARIIHANGASMQVVLEPLADVVALLKAEHEQPVLAVKRL